MVLSKLAATEHPLAEVTQTDNTTRVNLRQSCTLEAGVVASRPDLKA